MPFRVAFLFEVYHRTYAVGQSDNRKGLAANSAKRDYGGAYKCYKHAQELGVPIMNIADNIKNQEW